MDRRTTNLLRGGAEDRVGRAGRRRVEDGEREVLEDDADVEVDDAGGGDVDVDAADGEPHEEVLGVDAGDARDPALADHPGDRDVVAQADLGARRARCLQHRLEPPAAGVVLERRDPGGEQPPRELVPREHRVHGLLRRRRRLRRLAGRHDEDGQRPQRHRHFRRCGEEEAGRRSRESGGGGNN